MNESEESQIFESIKKDKDMFLRNRDMIALRTVRIIIGEIQRDPNKDYSDKNVTIILKKLRKMSLKNLVKDSLLIDMIDQYAFSVVSDIDVIEWIRSEFSYDAIVKAGVKKYFIIGIAKKHFVGEDINCIVVRDFLDDVVKNGEKYYDNLYNPKFYDIDVGPEIYQELIDDLTPNKEIKGD